MRPTIIKNPTHKQFMKMVEDYDKLKKPVRGPDWQVRGLFWKGDWYIWPGYYWTHQSASAELGIPFSQRREDYERGDAAAQMAFWYLNNEDDSLGEHVVMNGRAGDLPAPVPFLRGLER